jgi:hypothetical protein
MSRKRRHTGKNGNPDDLVYPQPGTVAEGAASCHCEQSEAISLPAHQSKIAKIRLVHPQVAGDDAVCMRQSVGAYL